MGVYLYTNEPYIPTANTIAYFPFIDNQVDLLSNYSLNTTWTQQTLWFSIPKGTKFIYSKPKENERFYWFWVKPNSSTSGALWQTNLGGLRFNWNVNNIKEFTMKDSWGTFHGGSISWTWTTDVRYYIAYTIDTSNNYKWWVNAVQKWSGTYAPNLGYTESWLYTDNNGSATTFSDFIIERTAWTADQVTAYFNKTKSRYWIS